MKNLEEIINQYSDHNKVREILYSCFNDYIDEYVKLLKLNQFDNLYIGRCFISDSTVRGMIESIVKNELVDFCYRCQAIYELLEYNIEVSVDKRKFYRDIIIANIIKYIEVCNNIYIEKYTKEGYLNSLLYKLEKTYEWKRWLYILELEVLYNDKELPEGIIEKFCKIDSFVNETIIQVRSINK